MSFSAQDILSEFADAARFATFDPEIELYRRLAERAERNRELMREYHRRPEVKRARRKRAARPPRAPYATPLPTTAGTCPRCGARTEQRAGLQRPVHFGRCTK